MTKRNIFIAVLTLVTLCLAQGAALAAQAAAPQKASEWADLIHQRYSAVNSLRASFTQDITHKESMVKEKREGELLFQKPMLVRWATRPPAEELIVVGEKEIWQYLPDEESAAKFLPEALNDQSGFLLVLTGQERLDKSFDLRVGKAQGDLVKLLLYPHEPTQNLVEASLLADPETGLIQSLTITDFYGNLNEISLSKYELNAKIPSGSFTFTPPKGTEIQDHTNPQQDFSKPLKQ